MGVHLGFSWKDTREFTWGVVNMVFSLLIALRGCHTLRVCLFDSGAVNRNAQQITDYKMAPKGAPVNGANLGSMGFKLSTKLINKLIIIR
jgi:hypothetical protein